MNLLGIVKQAVKEAEPELTSSLRKSAYDHGWNAECGRGLSVSCEGSSITVSMSQKAEDKEYGWYEAQPSPAVRHWQNETQQIEQALIEAVSRRLQGVL